MSEKKCTKCGEIKAVSEFNFKNKTKNRRNSRCRLCTRKDTMDSYYTKHDYYLAYRSRLNRVLRIKVNRFLYNYLAEHACVDCGLANPVVLHFDHVRGKKDFNISTMRSGRVSFKRLTDEIAKCVVRCANCHAIKTSKEQGWYNYLFEKLD